MPIGGVYDTGTVAVTNGSPTVVGTGVFWPDVLEGDHLVIAGLLSLVLSVDTGTNTITLMKPYQGASNATAAYQLVKMSWLRYDPSTVMYQVRDMLSRINDSNTGLFYYTVGAPDSAIGENGDLAIDVTGDIWVFWQKAAGIWVLQTAVVGGGSSNHVAVITDSQYGGVGDGATNNDAAIALAFASGAAEIDFSGGTFVFQSGLNNIPSHVRKLRGVGGRLKNTGGAALPSDVVIFKPSSTPANDLVIEGLDIEFAATRAWSVFIHASTGNSMKLRRCRLYTSGTNDGLFVIFFNIGTDCWVEDCDLTGVTRGLPILIDTCTASGVRRSKVKSTTYDHHTIAIGNSPAIFVLENEVNGSRPAKFGISLENCPGARVWDNRIYDTVHEAIGVNNSSSLDKSSIRRNTARWPSVASQDFGMSFQGDVEVFDNYIEKCGKSGLYFAAGRVSIGGNTIYNCNQLVDTTNGNGLELCQSALGPLEANVLPNIFISDDGKMLHGIWESHTGGTVGFCHVQPQLFRGQSGTAYLIAAASISIFEGVARKWTPTIHGTVSHPTLGTSEQHGHYSFRGDYIDFSFRISIGTISGGSGNASITLPVPVFSDGVFTYYPPCVITTNGVTWGSGPTMIIGYAQENTSELGLAGAQSNAAGLAIPVSAFSASDTILGSGTYRWR